MQILARMQPSRQKVLFVEFSLNVWIEESWDLVVKCYKRNMAAEETLQWTVDIREQSGGNSSGEIPADNLLRESWTKLQGKKDEE